MHIAPIVRAQLATATPFFESGGGSTLLRPAGIAAIGGGGGGIYSPSGQGVGLDERDADADADFDEEEREFRASVRAMGGGRADSRGEIGAAGEEEGAEVGAGAARGCGRSDGSLHGPLRAHPSAGAPSPPRDVSPNAATRRQQPAGQPRALPARGGRPRRSAAAAPLLAAGGR